MEEDSMTFQEKGKVVIFIPEEHFEAFLETMKEIVGPELFRRMTDV